MKLKKIVSRKLYLVCILVVLFILAVGTIFYKFSEEISWSNAIYLTVLTVMTVGYGDIAPVKPASRLFTMIYVLVSIPTVLFLGGYIIEDFFKRRIQKTENKINEVLIEEDEIMREERQVLSEEKKELEMLKEEIEETRQSRVESERK